MPKFEFDFRVNVPLIASAIAIIFTMGVGWASLNGRVSVSERDQSAIVQAVREMQTEMKRDMREMREAVMLLRERTARCGQ